MESNNQLTIARSTPILVVYFFFRKSTEENGSSEKNMSCAGLTINGIGDPDRTIGWPEDDNKPDQAEDYSTLIASGNTNEARNEYSDDLSETSDSSDDTITPSTVNGNAVPKETLTSIRIPLALRESFPRLMTALRKREEETRMKREAAEEEEREKKEAWEEKKEEGEKEGKKEGEEQKNI